MVGRGRGAGARWPVAVPTEKEITAVPAAIDATTNFMIGVPSWGWDDRFWT
jgi:hypothetical protein